MKREELVNLTIAEGLERIVLNDKKMNNLLINISKFSAWNSAVKCPYGIDGNDTPDTKPNQTFKIVQSKINGLIDSFNDLYKDTVLIKAAINYTNLHTKIETVLGVMSVHDALYMKDSLVRTEYKYKQDYGLITKAYQAIEQAKVTAQNDVNTYNQKLLNSNLSDDVKKNSMASVMYFINEEKSKPFEEVSILFSDQVNKKLNSINALTKLMTPPVIE